MAGVQLRNEKYWTSGSGHNPCLMPVPWKPCHCYALLLHLVPGASVSNAFLLFVRTGPAGSNTALQRSSVSLCRSFLICKMGWLVTPQPL